MQTEVQHVKQSEDANLRIKKRYRELNSTKELIIDDPRGYSVQKVSSLARLLHEFTRFSKKKNTIWAIAEADITDVLDRLQEHKKKTGESISFTAFLITVFARVVALHKYPMNSIIKKGKEIYTFNDVDFSTNIERTFPDGTKRPISYTIRKANEKTLRQINDELSDAKIAKLKTATSTKGKKGWIKWVIKRLPNFPRWIRYLLLRKMFNDPILKKNSMGTVNLTAVGMFGTGMGKMIHITPHTLSIGIGGIDDLPFVIDGKVVPRKKIGITLAMDHDVIDGGPATRFFHDVRQWLMFFCHEADWCFKSLENPPIKTE
ncbi:MAG: 2-oxo acid dehydrogenase subunit E2 [Candidatus Lokiarchaeota archaeon]|nr:2-oxo acid dehydrogenase subunit E2 [Candidatus Lokiarchaeota archaeon]